MRSGRALIVEDNATDRALLRALLEHESHAGAPILEAGDAHTAIALALEAKPDLVLLDMMLDEGPGGLHVLSVIRQALPDARLLVVSGLPRDHPRVQRCLKLGATGYLAKPVTRAALHAALARDPRVA